MVFYTVQVDVMVSLKVMINGGERIHVVESTGVAAWNKPLLRFQIPPRSRPGDEIIIPKGWTADDDKKGFDVVVKLHMAAHPPFVIRADDVYIKQSIVTNGKVKIGKRKLEFPDGSIEEVKIDEILIEGCKMKFKGRGMPHRGTSARRGTFIVILEPIRKPSLVDRLFRLYKLLDE